MLSRPLFVLSIICAALLATALTAALTFDNKQDKGRVEIAAAHSALDRAFATLAARKTALANALVTADQAYPATFASLYEVSTRSVERVPERAMALMPYFDSVAEMQAFHEDRAAEYAASGYPEFAPFPSTDTDILMPAMLVEPPEAREGVFGYNIATSERRLNAAFDAHARNGMTVTAPIMLSQDGQQVRNSLLFISPVYLNGAGDASTDAGLTRAVLAAGMTPSALIADYVGPFSARGIDIEIEIMVAGQALPIRLFDPEDGWLRLPLLTDVTMPAIRMVGFEVPFRASVMYRPMVLDAVPPLLAGVVTAIVGMLLLRIRQARSLAQARLRAALAAKEAELNEAYRVQARSQRVEALGRLVGGVAHDFNNILSVIMGNLELLRDTDRAEREPLVKDALDATQRGAHLTRQLLTIGRKSRLQPQRLVVADALSETSSMLRRVLPESIALVTVPAAGLWIIRADPDGLQNAILNLALNARDAMSGRGTLTIEARNTRATQDYLDDRPDEEIAPGRYVSIAVSDTGVGMSPEIADRAFDPFFTTKHATDGSGLGLPSVLGFCRQSGGTCRIYSEPGVGTTVRLYLPACGSDTTPSSDTDEKPLPQAEPGRRILLAEDDDNVAKITRRQLESAGYSVERTPNGDDAWEMLARGDRFDMLISDLVMPGHLQGADLARRAEVERPDIALLLISGYPEEAAIEGNGVASRHPVLTKPIPRALMLRTVSDILSRRAATPGPG